ncbi:Hypothetical protein AJAP_05055 [Amycolatopsis japonica]|uniref:Uncharacterized protein n=1 Tax=Amycolatopsis japonica TaxID=208439 RepID=A0A075UNE3_9PSEU|nr:hypothetical protein [Amycolatopsis japonica]AIG73931.1 Hypothetical protein AJAP_05055 [Amycolatopsis japonica]
MSEGVNAAGARYRGLDDWYREVNRIYLDKNFYRDEFSIFAHLVEVVGGLSLLASEKKKDGVDVNRHVPRAVAWWLALCGKVGIKSVEQMLWWKFPYHCPYCERSVHNNDICWELKEENRGPNWGRLERLGVQNEARRPSSIGAWQRMFGEIYVVDATASYAVIFARFTEELGELGEALRAFRVAPGYFLSEAADLFAWLMNLQNTLESKRKVTLARRGERLDEAFSDSYPGRCRDCGAGVCACPAILQSTLGRIAHELPVGRRVQDVGHYSSSFVSVQDIYTRFDEPVGLTGSTGHDFTFSKEQLNALNGGISQLIQRVIESQESFGSSAASLVNSLHLMGETVRTQRLSNHEVSDVAHEVAALEASDRETVIGLLRQAGIGIIEERLVEAVEDLASG